MHDIATAVLWLSLSVFHEARGEPPQAQLAVAQTVVNRSKQSDKTIEEVVKQKHQFSWRKNKKRTRNPWKTHPEEFLDSTFIALKALNTPDKTGGATHFHSMKRDPYWAKKMKLTKKSGKMKFYRERRG